MDEAFLKVNNELEIKLVVSWMSNHCYQVGLFTYNAPTRIKNRLMTHMDNYILVLMLSR